MVIENNALWRGARGSLGGLVFQSWGDKVIVRTEPRERKVPVSRQSERQRQTRVNFKDAAVYAKRVTRDREQKAYYARKAKAIGVRSAYSAAISDYMRGLTIESVDTRRYHGQAGGQIKVTVRKRDFAAKAVNVILKTTAGAVIERGAAVMELNGGWVYKNQVGTQERVVLVEVEAMGCCGKWKREVARVDIESTARGR